MHTPNLFSFAYGELSQDAFICWLLSWADKKYAEDDQSLHECALRFIKAMFAKHGLTAPDHINHIEVKQQHHRIDVFCIINNEYAIIIEDKTSTKNHSEQLVRYREKIEKEYSGKKILCIYYKTEEQGSYEDIEKKEFKPFLRQDMLEALKPYEGSHDVLLSYRAHIQAISDEVESYKTLSLAKWHWRSWMGFYVELQSRLGNGDWSYVANPSGGFLGFWWHWSENDADDKCSQYLQLQQIEVAIENSDETKTVGVLCFKIEVAADADQGALRDKWHQEIKAQGENHSLLKLDKPARFGKGVTMTMCEHKDEYRIANEKNVIDMDKTVELLESAMKVLDTAKESAG